MMIIKAEDEIKYSTWKAERVETAVTERQTVREKMDVWEEATEGGDVWMIGQTRGPWELLSCVTSAQSESARRFQPPSSDLRSPLHTVTQWLLNAAFRPVQLDSKDESLNFSSFYFWRGSRFCAAEFPLRGECWSAPRPRMRAPVGLIRPSGELLF